MSADDLHKIFEPYLFAGAAVVAILGGTGLLLRRDGRRRREAGRAHRDDAKERRA